MADADDSFDASIAIKAGRGCFILTDKKDKKLCVYNLKPAEVEFIRSAKLTDLDAKIGSLMRTVDVETTLMLMTMGPNYRLETIVTPLAKRLWELQRAQSEEAKRRFVNRSTLACDAPLTPLETIAYIIGCITIIGSMMEGHRA